ncbi:MAG: hypothetical protein PHS93_06070 [Candidatus Omnitrophica bacterium]|nr:hypothetical protein [Candidatus Omnitrophota bacterium]MDD5352718.1 hypothetical protein [Candidatus Omnitrophota bacterium]MDD5550317.1 hypothetical protein [Candidatus Omnitrophota bacterium]
MSKLRRLKIFSYVLPITLAIFLFSIASIVLADSFYHAVYIGKIRATRVNIPPYYNTTGEMTLLQIYSDPQLQNITGTFKIPSGTGYGYPVDYPIGLISTASFALEHHLAVDIFTTTVSGIGTDVITLISPIEFADDIATTVSEIQDTADGIYSQIVGQSGMLNAIDNHVLMVNTHLSAQDIVLDNIWSVVRRWPRPISPQPIPQPITQQKSK